jgi:hypothetical protein
MLLIMGLSRTEFRDSERERENSGFACIKPHSFSSFFLLILFNKISIMSYYTMPTTNVPSHVQAIESQSYDRFKTDGKVENITLPNHEKLKL